MQYLTQLFIRGEWVEPARQGTLDVINPATEDVISEVAAATEEDVELAVAAARKALPEWRRLTGTQRGKYLREFASAVQQRKSRLAGLQSRNNGKTLVESEYDMDAVSACFNYYADLAEQLDLRQNQPVTLPSSAFKSHTRFEPAGVVGLIVPWNYPLMTASWKLAPALAAGCTAVLKPSEITPLIELELGAIAQEIGLPAGVLNIVTGTGPDVGAPLCAHPGIDKLSFTGSTPTGTKIMETAAQSVKGVSLELGGKSPILVFDDADIDDAVEWICGGIFANAGQMCSATSRLLVQQSIYPKLMKALLTAVADIRVGDPFNAEVTMGALTSRQQYDKVLTAIAEGKRSGATLAAGGEPVPGLERGYFVQPTVFTDVPLNSSLWRDEIFGPVLAIRTFESETEAVELANDSCYGLIASLVTSDEARIQRVSEALEAGHIFVNGHQELFVETSWGGFKKSGIGRELGPWGLDEFLEVKHITRGVKPGL
ncbi:aldehyde dehydrogenase family protein [Marinobacter sp. DY40_1A1]|uniref:aldehyde dehydrogenase family protein n=1 Tax=Marinobacter sp. DY40_1A1 TaxID=2583229 RepID=UPI001908B3B6|nr:aldehyde dehydrogenase family protein [Marinobacter sp. DY40_1A1]MBK1885634.1 aldehyde dehydrogenase family protein [Marinobacter sp. DY40_1A1]